MIQQGQDQSQAIPILKTDIASRSARLAVDTPVRHLCAVQHIGAELIRVIRNLIPQLLCQ
jgi:hypothetical protein